MSLTTRTVLEEYSSDDAVRRYSNKTAGFGINYLLDHDYGDIYLAVLRNHLSARIGRGLRLLEFGCGAGMNLIHLLRVLSREKLPVEAAYGTDLSERLICEASRERAALPPELACVRFFFGRNEELIGDMTRGLRIDRSELLNTFHLIIGVNTFRYCHRLKKDKECAGDIYDLLAPGGVCVIIDMNHKFPMFRSRVHDRIHKTAEERYLPTLKEYAAPFGAVGFEVLDQRNFCWIPHSAGPALAGTFRTLTPILNLVAPSFAMRSLVIARKPKVN
jgi:SAM-dependent methyltransferase